MPELNVHPSRIPCHAPATRERLGEVAVDSRADVEAAVERARRAQRVFRRSSLADRQRLLRALLDRTLEETDDIVDAIVRDAGKTRENALVGEIWTVCEKLRWTLSRGPRHLRPERVSSGLLLHKRARLEFHPLGVIGAIIPWNYPFQNIMNPVIPALMAGNAVVVKPSEWVAWSSARFIEMIRDVLVEEGFPPDLVMGVQGYGETGAALVRGGVDAVVFIGSAANGRRVLEGAAERLIPTILELGGKDPFIVLDDASVEQAAHAALAGCFINCGQNCVASERIIVTDGVYDRFEARVAELVSDFRQGPSQAGGPPVDVGAITTPLQLEIVERLVSRAIEDGARVVAGGERVLRDQGDFFAPTILADVTPEMDIMHEETFGPVMLLSRVKNAREAVSLANATAYGLSASVFSRDHAKARRVAAQIETGMTAVNDFGGITYMAQELTFGGVKRSGFGRINGREGLRAMCNIKSVVDDRFPLHLPTRIFPVGARDFDTQRGVVELLYGRGRQRLRGLATLVGAALGRERS